MQHTRFVPAPVKSVAVFDEILNAHHRGRRNSEPLRLRVEIFVKLEIGLVN